MVNERTVQPILEQPNTIWAKIINPQDKNVNSSPKDISRYQQEFSAYNVGDNILLTEILLHQYCNAMSVNLCGPDIFCCWAYAYCPYSDLVYSLENNYDEASLIKNAERFNRSTAFSKYAYAYQSGFGWFIQVMDGFPLARAVLDCIRRIN